MKNIYYQFSDGADVSKVIMSLLDCVAWIESDTQDIQFDDDGVQREYTITPILLTDEEYENLPEACI